MIKRFEGKEAAALLEQAAVEHDAVLAKELASVGELKSLAKGDFLMRQSGNDNHISFVLAGSVSVEVNGKQVAIRHPNQHVGEMAVIDPSARRSADVRALEETIVFDVAEARFSALAEKFPKLWRRLAIELASRLRERSKLMRKANDVPHVFIGSTAERLETARTIQAAFSHDGFVVRTWADAIFKAGGTPIESLVASLESLDFSVLLVTPDDLTTSRDEAKASPRDNVIFELGLAYGALGRDRTFMIRDRGVALKLPSDLLGVRALEIQPGVDADLDVRVQPAITELRRIIKQVGVRVG